MNFKKMPATNKIYFAVVLYALLALNRIKIFLMPSISGIKITNMIVIVGISVAVIMFIARKRTVAGYTISQIVFFLLLLLCCLSGLFFSNDLQQSAYALILMLLPMLFLIFIQRQREADFFTILKLLAICSIIYSIITVISAFNYSTLMHLIGNSGSSYNNRTRASLPLGSSITVSYYLNMSLPIILLLYLRASTKKEKYGWLIGILLNIFATLIQLSRSAAYTTALILVLFFLLMHNKSEFRRKTFLQVILIVGIIYVFSTFDLSRLTQGVFLNRTGSDAARYYALDLGWNLFECNPLFGTGVGKYFFRAWSGSNCLLVDGVSGLIDPHCAVILLLSETGVFGSVLYAVMLLQTLALMKNIEDKLIRITSYLVAIAIAVNNLGGSQIINEINYTSIAFIYLAIFAGMSVTQQREVRRQ